jgi:hypothetical protein
MQGDFKKGGCGSIVKKKACFKLRLKEKTTVLSLF